MHIYNSLSLSKRLKTEPKKFIHIFDKCTKKSTQLFPQFKLEDGTFTKLVCKHGRLVIPCEDQEDCKGLKKYSEDKYQTEIAANCRYFNKKSKHKYCYALETKDVMDY